MKKIGENIRFYRNLRSLTQTALARRVQVAPAYISQIEANQRVPSLKVTQRIAGVLGIDMSILVREATTRIQEGRLTVSEKLDLLRTLMVAIEGESHEAGEGEALPPVIETGGTLTRELHSEPSFCLVLREFSGAAVFGRESADSDLECHIVLEGRLEAPGGGELAAGACLSLSGAGTERLRSVPGARVLSAYGPRVPLGLLAGVETAAEPPAPR